MSVKPSDGIGKRLAKYRTLAGLSARELAEQAGSGLSRGVIANVESGRKQDLTVDQLISISAVLRIPPAVLALPLDTPNRFVRVTGQHTFDDGRIMVRAAETARWFNGQRHLEAPENTRASNVAFVELRLLTEYLLLKDQGDAADPEEVQANREMLELSGFDMTSYRVDE